MHLSTILCEPWVAVISRVSATGCDSCDAGVVGDMLWRDDGGRAQVGGRMRAESGEQGRAAGIRTHGAFRDVIQYLAYKATIDWMDSQQLG